jgi:hypothetical protein
MTEKALQKGALTRIFGPKRDEVTEDSAKLQNGELHNLNFPPSTITMIRSKRMGCTGHVP